MSNNANSRYLRHTDEMGEGCLHLHDVVEAAGERTYVLRWTLRDYRALAFGVQYSAHHIRIGGALHRLRLLKLDTKFRTLPTNNRLVYVYLGLTPDSPAAAGVRFSILRSDGDEIPPLGNSSDVFGRFFHHNLVNRKCYSGFVEPPEFLSRNHNPTVICRIALRRNDDDGGDSADLSVERAATSATLSSDIGDLLKEGRYSDLTVRVGGRTFETHVAVLAARSPVFDAMLRNEMREKNERMLDVPDFEADIFEELLRYLYTGRTGPLSVDRALPLMRLADKYDVRGLKSDLEEFLRSNLSAARALDVFVAADMCDAGGLKAEVLRFIGGHLGELMGGGEWKLFRSHADLVDEILAYVSSEMYEY